jgi:hypothetical protein
MFDNTKSVQSSYIFSSSLTASLAFGLSSR